MSQMYQEPKFQTNKSLSELSTLGIGGPARVFVEVREIGGLQSVLRRALKEGLSFLVLGKGSNCLFDDRGFDGLVILNKIAFLEIGKEEVYVGAGYSFSRLGAQTARRGLAGLEFASGIPATVGGAVWMNAGANGMETADALLFIDYVNEEGALERLERSALDFSYRHSPFQARKGAIAAASFALSKGAMAREKQLEIIAYRTRTQPYGEKSAGCVFRNPEGGSAGALIDACGLKGTGIGGAVVSDLHANFIINKGGAKAEEVLCLARHIQQVVKERKGVDLEMEMRVIGYDPLSR